MNGGKRQGGERDRRKEETGCGTDAEFQKQDLPPTLAHELLGHGLWYGRAIRESALQVFHHHELNEANARLVGWLVDFELDGRFEEAGAWAYLADPVAFLQHLKLHLTNAAWRTVPPWPRHQASGTRSRLSATQA